MVVRQVVLDLGGLGVALAGPVAWLDRTSTRLAAFLAARPPDLVIHWQAGPGPRPLPLHPAVAVAFPLAQTAGDAVDLRWAALHARVDLGARRVECRGETTDEALDAVLKHVLPLALGDGLVLHASAVGGAEGVYAFSGPSGAGKSTIAALFPERTLADELIAVRVRGRDVTAHALPWERGLGGSGRLRALFLLAHAAEHTAARIDPVQAVRELSGQVLWPTYHAPSLARAFSTLAHLVGLVPVARLAFAPLPDVWSVVAEVA
jgi:hypothetical protein